MEDKITSPETPLFRTRKTYSPEEILAAGGTTAFSRKSGKDNINLAEKLKEVPDTEPFTDEEWRQALQQLQDSK